jgi:hypothetical protein
VTAARSGAVIRQLVEASISASALVGRIGLRAQVLQRALARRFRRQR